jgi:hypothetical protein
MVEITFILLSFGNVMAMISITSWIIKKITASILLAGMIGGCVGTFVMLIMIPVTETLPLAAIVFTIFGFFTGRLLNWIGHLRKRLSEKRSKSQ